MRTKNKLNAVQVAVIVQSLFKPSVEGIEQLQVLVPMELLRKVAGRKCRQTFIDRVSDELHDVNAGLHLNLLGDYLYVSKTAGVIQINSSSDYLSVQLAPFDTSVVAPVLTYCTPIQLASHFTAHTCALPVIVVSLMPLARLADPSGVEDCVTKVYADPLTAEEVTENQEAA